MEGACTGKSIEWPFIVEHFTKRGRPLTKEELKALQEEDRRMAEEAKEQTRLEEAAERRRQQRL